MANCSPNRARNIVLYTFCVISLLIFSLLVILTRAKFNAENDTCGTEPVLPGEAVVTCAPPPSVFTGFDSWTDSQYFVGSYLPTLIAVVYHLFWDVIYMTLRETEPFFQLAKRDGVRLTDSLLLHYGSASLPKTLYLAVVNRHGYVFLASFISLILTIGVPFASEIVYIGTTGVCNSTTSGAECKPYLAVRPSIAEFEAAIMAISFILVSALGIAYRKREAVIHSEATSIAGLAVLLNDTSFINTLRQSMNQSSTANTELLNRYYYTIAQTQGPGQSQEVSPIGFRLRPKLNNIKHIQHPNHSQNQEILDEKATYQIRQHSPVVLSPYAVCFAGLCLGGLLILILCYRFIGTPSGFEIFMDSQSVGVRLMMTTFGVLIRSYWTLVEKDIRIREPLWRLAQGQARAEDTILVESRSHAITAFFVDLSRGRLLLAYIALLALLSEILTVTLSGVPFNSSESYIAYLVSTYLSVAILALMLLGLVAVLVLTDGLEVPYQMDNILSTLFYLCHSRMIQDFSDLSVLDTKTRNQRIMNMRRMYRYGRIENPEQSCVVYSIDYEDA